MFSYFRSTIEYFWSLIIYITNSKYEFIFYIFLAILIYAIYALFKRIRMNMIIAEKGLRNAKVFRFGIDTLMAISDNGLICIVNVKFEAVVINIKDIAGIEVHLSKYVIQNADKNENDGLIFNGVGDRIMPILQEEKTKGVILYIKLKNDELMSISLFKGTRLKTIPTEGNQNIIVTMFKTLEALERKYRGIMPE